MDLGLLGLLSTFHSVEDTYALDVASSKSELFLVARPELFHRCEEDGG